MIAAVTLPDWMAELVQRASDVSSFGAGRAAMALVRPGFARVPHAPQIAGRPFSDRDGRISF